MTTALYTHPACLAHRMNDDHPESPERLRAVLDRLAAPEFAMLDRREAPAASDDDLALAHDPAVIRRLFDAVPDWGLQFVDDETLLCAESGEAARRAAGAVLAAVAALAAGGIGNAFCAVRPPGHHAGARTPGGFCLFNNAAIGALAARRRHGIARVAVVDYDVHHGNGTQDILWDEDGVLFVSLHQHPLYPGTGRTGETGTRGQILNIPLPAGSDGAAYRAAFADTVLPALERFAPELVIVSAGYDAHAADPLAGMRLTADDFGQMTAALRDVADRHAGGRLLLTLEGGYDPAALADSVAASVHALMAPS